MTPEQEEEIPRNSFITLMRSQLSPVEAAVAASELRSARGLKCRARAVQSKLQSRKVYDGNQIPQTKEAFVH